MGTKRNKSKISKAGRSGRGEARANRVKRVELKADKIVSERLSCLQVTPIDTNCYQQQLEKVDIELKKVFSSVGEYYIAKKYLAMRIDAGNKAGRWKLDVPDVPIKLRRHRQTRTKKWHKAAGIITVVASKIEKLLADPEIFDDLDKSELKFLVALSAMQNGGLNEPEALVTLVNQLSPEIIMSAGEVQGQELIWIELNYSSTTVHNVVESEEYFRCRRWFVDTQSLCCINRFLQCKDDSEQVALNKKSLFDGIKCLLRKLNIKIAPINTLSALAKGGVAVCESQPAVKISNVLTEIAANNVPSVSLHPTYWKYLGAPAIISIDPIIFSDYEFFYSNLVSGGNKSALKKDAASMMSSLNKSLVIKDAQMNKRTKNDALTSLQELDVSGWTEGGRCLRDWYIELLESTSIKKVGTVKRYNSEVAKDWLVLDDKCDIRLLGIEDFEDEYDTILDRINSPKSKIYRARILERFHRFAAIKLKLPMLITPLCEGAANIPMVRAGYVPNVLYLALLAEISRIEGLDKNSKEAIAVLVSVAYRTGLRLGELIKLRLKDVEPSAERWLFIRTNRYGDNKCTASLRKIPLAALFDDVELARFNSWVGFRNKITENKNEVVFCREGEGTHPWDSQVISRIVSDLMRKLSGIDTYIFHHLRHTAFCNMQVIGEREWGLAEQLTGFDKEKLAALFTAVVGNTNERLRIYWAIACFAGHNSPQTTLLSYMHFSDLLIYLKLSRSEKTLTLAQSKGLSDLSAHKLTSLFKKDSKVRSGLLVSSLRSPVQERCRKWMDFGKKHDLPDIEITDDLGSQSSLRQMTHDVTYRILDEYQQGFPLIDLVYRYNIPEKTIKRWINNAEYLASIVTREGERRLISKKRNKSKRGTILPAKLRHDRERQDAATIIRALRKTYRIEKTSVDTVISYYGIHVNSSSSGILFHDHKVLKKFIETLEPAIKIGRWNLEVSVPKGIQSNEYTDRWKFKPAINISINEIKASREIKSAYLYLGHPQEQKYLQNNDKFGKYSASTLRYVFHMLAIMVF